MNARILIVEDEADLAQVLAYNLEREHFLPEVAPSGEEALERLARPPRPDLIVLDRMLPGIGGDQVLADLRSDPAIQDVPVMVLTARDAEPDRVAGLALGADDYVVKPFSVREVVLRIRAILRRVEQRRTLVVDEAAHVARVEDHAVDLTVLEVGLLGALRGGAVWSRSDLVQRVWGEQADIEVVDSAVKRLRRKLEPLGFTIAAVRSVGFRLEPFSGPSS